jgi:ATP-binding cassette subfamily C protein CydCD
MATLRIAFLSALALELIATISVAVVAVFIGVRLNHGSLGLETGLLVLILASDCYLPFREVGAAHHAAESGREALQRVKAILNRQPSKLVPVDSSNAAQIEVRDLGIHFGDRSAPAVSGLRFSAPRGSMVLLDGPSGSGKSSVLAAMAGLLGSDSQTTVSGEIHGLDRARIAWVSQHPATSRERVINEAGDDPERALPALSRLGIDHLAERHPAELSPGELRRLAFARALVRIDSGANLLLLDEPTAHLDSESAQRIADVIEELTGSVTIVIASHDPLIQQLADVRVPLGQSADGRLIGTDQQEFPAFQAQSEPVVYQPSGLTTQTNTERRSFPNTIRRLDDLLGLRQRAFVTAAILGLLAAGSAVALTALSGWLIVRASEQPPILQLMVAIVGVRFFGIGRAVFRYCERLSTHNLILRATSRLRVRIWASLIAQGPAMRRRLRGDSALDALIGDVDQLRDLTPRVVLPPLVGLLTGVAATIALSVIDPSVLPIMAICLVVSLILSPALVILVDRSNVAAGAELNRTLLRRFAGLLGAATDLRANGLDRHAIEETRAIDAERAGIARSSALIRGAANALVVASCVGASLAMLWVIHDAVPSGEISAELAAVLVLTPLALIDPFLGAIAALQQLPALEMAIDRLEWIGAKGADQTQPVSAAAMPALDSIELERVEAAWPESDRVVFQNLSVGLGRGDWLIVTGPSGSGKSTLLSIVMAFLRPAAGVYRQNGFDTKGMAPESIRRSIAWCPQEAFLFDSTLRANLLIARSRENAPDDPEMLAALEKVGLGNLVRNMPDGLSTRIGSQGSHLSGGERQRVAIARTLLAGADLILIDEPTANLDRATADTLMIDLRSALHDRLVIAVTHNPADIAPADIRVELGEPAPVLT